MSISPVGLAPLIGVFDMPAALAFYRDVPGFTVFFAAEEVETAEGRFSHFVWLQFGGAELMLNTQYDSMSAPAGLQRRVPRMLCFTSIALM
jgi:glyoxylase I family protein